MDKVNVLLPELRGKIKKEVPFITGAWVEFYDDVTGELYTIAETAVEKKDYSSTLDLLMLQIASWNFADNVGIMEVSKESLSRLPLKIIKWMSETQAELLGALQDKKKEELATS